MSVGLKSSPNSFTHGYGSIPIDTFLVGWTSIYQKFWGSPGVQGFWHTATLGNCPVTCVMLWTVQLQQNGFSRWPSTHDRVCAVDAGDLGSTLCHVNMTWTRWVCDVGFLLENDVKSCNIGEVRWKIGVNYDGIPNFQTFDIFSKKGENWGFNSGIQPESGCDIPHEYCFLGCILWILCSWLVGWASQC